MLIVGIFLFPTIALASVDQRCFTKEQCIQTRKDFFLPSSELEDGFYRTQETVKACGDLDAKGRELGFCLPLGKSKTQVQFGSTKEFEDVGDFIQKMYRYGIGAGIFLAAAMILIGGLRWSASAGNPNSISNAQKQIGGAIVGLFLLVFSYNMLNTINPYLTNLRLPQIWMINTIGLAPVYCKETNANLGEAMSAKEKKSLGYDPKKIDSAIEKKFSPSVSYALDKTKATCNHDYFVEGTGGATCRGSVCEKKDDLCYTPFNGSHDECGSATIAGKISNPGFYSQILQQAIENGTTVESLIGQAVNVALYEGWAWPWVNDRQKSSFWDAVTSMDLDDDIEIWAVCEGGKLDDLASAKVQNNSKLLVQNYIFDDDKEAILAKGKAACIAEPLGYVIAIEANEGGGDITDETHIIGKNGTTGVDLGDERAFYNSIQFKNETLRNLLISKEDIMQGLVINIDMSSIYDIDGGRGSKHAASQRRERYIQYGYCYDLDIVDDWWRNAGEYLTTKLKCKNKPVTE